MDVSLYGLDEIIDALEKKLAPVLLPGLTPGGKDSYGDKASEVSEVNAHMDLWGKKISEINARITLLTQRCEL